MKNYKFTKMKRSIASGLLFLLITTNSMAGVIVSATDAIVNFGGPGYDDLVHTHNQDGLYDTYIDGVTDFDDYIASNPFHTSDYFGFEWFSEIGTGTAPVSASVTYNLGKRIVIDAIALWNEESSGIGILDLFGSLDGINFFNIAEDLMPQDNPFNLDKPYDDYRYKAEAFEFSAFNLQYIKFDMSGCPNQPSPFYSCSIGEVAFRTADIPEPSTFFLAILALAGLAGLGRNRNKSKLSSSVQQA